MSYDINKTMPYSYMAKLRFDGNLTKEIKYNSARLFIEKLTDLSNEAVMYQPTLITFTYTDNNKKYRTLRFYGVNEFLLFVNGMRILGTLF
jgi:hypothetical protein